MIDLIVVNYKTYGLIGRFLASYRKFKPSIDSRLILVDNESDQNQLYRLNLDGVDVYPFKENLGYSGACNFAASLGNSEFIAFLNSDTEFVDNKCVDTCVDYLATHEDVAVVGPLQYSNSGMVTHGGIFGTHSKPEHRGWRSKSKKNFRDVRDAVTVQGSALFTKRSIWDQMTNCSIFRETFPGTPGAFGPFPHFYDETLYNYHVYGHGYKCVYLGTAEMIHEWHQSSEIGSQAGNMKIGREGFREFCDNHGIPHD